MSGEAAALTFLLQKVTEALIDYKDVKTGAGYEFRQLSDELLLLKAFLKDSAKKSNKENLFREKERQIRELVYDVEDTIDTCLTRRAVAKNKNAFGRLLEKISNDLAQKVKLLRQRKVRPVVDGIEREFGKIEDGNGSSTSLGKPRTDLKKGQSAAQPSITFIHNEQQQCVSLHNEDEESIGEDRIVDFEQEESIGEDRIVDFEQEESIGEDRIVDFEEEEIIISYLKESKDELDVISISGMAGLGKTTLARKIFQNEEIRRKFPLRIWIHVSQKFKSRDVFLEILERFIPGVNRNQRDEAIITTVRSCLANNEFLLVMDDVWTVTDWDVIEKILPTENGKGKVLVTSRLRGLAAQTNVNRKLVDLSPLESEKSLQLLKVKVFGSAKACPVELEDIGQAIANKCGGVPLIIVVIGGVLKLQFTDTRAISGLRQKWLDVLGNVNKILFEDENKSISDVIELSYNRLPDDLRMCFLYTGLFPENHDIPASTLTQLWIAEGFIQRQDGQSFEENADKILDTLINMNLLTVAKKNLDQVKTCGVHDMIREFCKAKATEQNLFRVMKKSRDGVIEPSVAELPNFRRLCLHSDPLRFLAEKPKGPRVRSFLCFFNEPFDLDATHLSTIPDAFNLLRVLSCKSIKFRQFPEVSKLKLLKHITLFIKDLIVLPEQLSQLINLQTLIVDTNSRSIKAKANIWKMIQLRRLKAKAAISLNGKKWEGKASENLQTISRLSPDSCVAALSKRAPNLKTLGIQGKVANLFNTFSLQEFHRLEKLKLVNDLDRASASENPLLALPQWSHFPPILKTLTLSKTYLDWGRHMPILAQINTLKVLKLKDNAFAGAFWIADDAHNSFQELQFLLIENSDLVIWNPSTTHFRSLTWLVLKKCKKLEKIPGSLAENLEKLEIEGVKKSAAESARKIESAANIKQEENHKWVVPFKLTVGPECDL